MRQQHIAAIGFAGVVLATPASAAESSDGVLLFGTQLAELIEEAIASGYRAAPALMLGLAMLLAVPAMVFASRIYQWSTRSAEATRLYRRRGFVESDVSEDVTGAAPSIPGHAFLEVVGVANARFAILRDMFRIGREDDNDIRIRAGGVHRYHAAIHREDFGEYRITDLSGFDGNGIVVNGRRCGGASLHDGDVIELGPGRLRFHAGLL
ncbi:MAG: FHA domain-containing protein [Hyphomicrobium sp.]